MRTVSKGYDPVKRGKDSWLLRVSVSEDGKSSKRLNKTVHCRTKTEAKRLLEEWRVELMTARTRMDRSNKTLEEFLREHVTYLHDVKHLSANTIRGYRDIVETRWVPRLGTTLLKDLKPYMIEDQLAWMRQSGGLNGKPLSGNTCQKALSFLKTALKRARRLEYIESNPCELVDVPSKEKKEVRVIDENEVSRMKIALLGCPDYRFAAATNLALDTGMRRGELCALRWRDVDLDGGVIRVRRARDGHLLRRDPGGEAAQEQPLEQGRHHPRGDGRIPAPSQADAALSPDVQRHRAGRGHPRVLQ